VSVQLDERNAPSDAVWYRIDLEEADYSIETVGSRVDGLDSNVQYRIDGLTGFGETEDEDRLLVANEIGTVVSANDEFDISEPGSYWLIVRNSNAATTNVEFTINEATN
jgi:hypothetical protein